jgi:hypothetical protein
VPHATPAPGGRPLRIVGLRKAISRQSPAEIPSNPAAQYNRSQGYYAVFFADPDLLKLEFAFTPN